MYPPVAELPPRARRIHAEMKRQQRLWGTTSACAENTPRCDRVRLEWRNYLRVRGEYSNAESKGTTSAELPPRARRILGRTESKIRLIGTTSACAENTPHGPQRPGQEWNYLRVRGEYPTRYATKMDRAELPPRARRILGLIRCCKACRGTTSACAENTQHVEPCKLFRRNYLRVRGEYDSTYTHAGVLPELPPRARRILHDESHVTHLIGTTSACAENTI